jgi:hypothetical protein
MGIRSAFFMGIVCVGAPLAACSSDSGLFGDSVGNTGTGSGAGVGGTSTVTSNGVTNASGPGSGDSTATGPQPQSVQASSAEASSVQASSAQASSVQASSAATTVAASSSSSGGGTNHVSCGDNKTCEVSNSQACCWDQHKLYPGDQGSCVKGDVWQDGCDTSQNGYGGETRIECQTAANCMNGESCCGRRKTYWKDNKSYQVYDQVVCQQKCNTNSGEVTFCVPNVTQCPQMWKDGGGWVTGVCKQSTLLPKGYNVCSVP